VVRPWLHCPEIDEVDEIPLENIISCDNEPLKVGKKVEYRI
jgi:hypothetical protein